MGNSTENLNLGKRVLPPLIECVTRRHFDMVDLNRKRVM